MITEILSIGVILAAVGASLRWNWWRMPKTGIPVLMYHKIGNPPAGSKQRSLWISNEQFDFQMSVLKNKGYESVTFADIKAGRLPAKPVVITFDDGYLNQRTEPLPILKKYGLRGVFYIVVEAMGRDNFWHNPESEIRLPMMNWSQVKEILDAGHEIGSHAMTHSRMDLMPFEKAKQEFIDSKRILEEKLGVPMISFAFPYGRGEDVPDLVKAVHEAGYGWVIGIHAGIWDGKNSWDAIPRIYVRGDDNAFDFYLQLRAGKSRV